VWEKKPRRDEHTLGMKEYKYEEGRVGDESPASSKTTIELS